eukprot:SAG11_NODE_19354_length_468_cov_1.501355_1_plen_79_part_01
MVFSCMLEGGVPGPVPAVLQNRDIPVLNLVTKFSTWYYNIFLKLKSYCFRPTPYKILFLQKMPVFSCFGSGLPGLAHLL